MPFIQRLSFSFLCWVFFATSALAQANNTARQFSLVPESTSGVGFRNDIVETESMFLYIYEYLYVGAGVSTGDINNDGLPDIYFTSTPVSYTHLRAHETDS